MKVKLLKKLRKEAKEKFVIYTTDGKRFKIKKILGYTHFGEISTDIIGEVGPKAIPDLIKHLEYVRKDYILQKIKILRADSDKIRKINEELSKL